MTLKHRFLQWWRDTASIRNRMMRVLLDRTGELKMSAINDACEKVGEKMAVERDMIVGGVKVQIESIFSRQTTLDKAIKNIILRKSTEG